MNLPLFPLQSVLFPAGLLPLKIFEARYLDLVSQCLRTSAPFGVVCLMQGGEAGPSPQGVRIEPVGTAARIDDVDAQQAGILMVRCTGTQRFTLQQAPTQESNGLWRAEVEWLPDDEPTAPPEALRPTVDALARATQQLKAHGPLPFHEPLQLDDAGWVANRWCELLPISLAARQKLMALEEPVVRLRLVDEFLRSRQIVRD